MSDERLMDLVRYARHYLSEQNLITDSEFADLVADNDFGQRVARLESYDDLRAQLATLTAERDTWEWAVHAKDKQLSERQEHEEQFQLQIAAVRAERDAAAAALVMLKEAAEGIRHWHDWGKNDEGMIVSHDAVFDLWNVLGKIKDPAAILAARDARIRAEGKAEGLREAADHCRTTDLLMPLPAIGITYRAYGANVCLALAEELDRMAEAAKKGREG